MFNIIGVIFLLFLFSKFRRKKSLRGKTHIQSLGQLHPRKMNSKWSLYSLKRKKKSKLVLVSFKYLPCLKCVFLLFLLFPFLPVDDTFLPLGGFLSFNIPSLSVKCKAYKNARQSTVANCAFSMWTVEGLLKHIENLSIGSPIM